MNVFVIIQQMLVLLIMMITGFFCYKGNWLDDNSYGKLSKIAVNILNPCIMINSVLGKEVTLKGEMLWHNVFLVVIYFALIIALSFPIVRIFGYPKRVRNVYMLMLTFSNVGFMGIPVVSSIYGQGAVIIIALYSLGYNVLLYSYGMYLAGMGEALSEEEKKGQWKKMLNPGLLSCVVALAILISGVSMPDSVCTFFSYMGNSVVPISMMLIGASLAQGGKKEFFTDIRMYAFSAVKMLLIPISVALLIRIIPGINQWEAITKGVFILMLSMPVGSIVVMLAKQCGADEIECTKGSIVSTLLSVLTIPIVGLFLPF